MASRKELSAAERSALLATLRKRFEANNARHEGLEWRKVEEKLEHHPSKLWSLFQMEESGGEPDVISYDADQDEYLFCDCSAESPKERRSLCYDEEALQSRKQHKPKGSAVESAAGMGAELLTEEQYRALQELGEFDTKTSSWIQTPVEIRERGGALFCDRRYDTVFVYHNGAESYYAARGFRVSLRIA